VRRRKLHHQRAPAAPIRAALPQHWPAIHAQARNFVRRIVVEVDARILCGRGSVRTIDVHFVAGASLLPFFESRLLQKIALPPFGCVMASRCIVQTICRSAQKHRGMIHEDTFSRETAFGI
jgi:hypothetical protein